MQLLRPKSFETIITHSELQHTKHKYQATLFPKPKLRLTKMYSNEVQNPFKSKKLNQSETNTNIVYIIRNVKNQLHARNRGGKVSAG